MALPPQFPQRRWDGGGCGLGVKWVPAFNEVGQVEVGGGNSIAYCTLGTFRV